MQLEQLAQQAFQAHVVKEFPKEAVGLLIGGVYYPCTNTHPHPEHRFRLELKERNDLEQLHGPVQALLHSHPYTRDESKECWKIQYNPVWPSFTDQEAFLEDTIPWGIASTDGSGLSEMLWMDESEILPLIERTFAVFTADCYTAIRDWHRVNTGIVLPNFARKFLFWKTGPNGEKGLNTLEDYLLTVKNITKLSPDKAEYGDVTVFAEGGSPVPNHFGVICGNNEMYHHAPGVRSAYARIVRWDLYRPKCLYILRIGKE